MSTTPSSNLVPEYATPAPAPQRSAGRRGLLGWVLFIGLAIMLFLLLKQRGSTTMSGSISQLYNDLENGVVTTVVIRENELLYHTASGTSATNLKLPAGLGANWNFIQSIRTASPQTQIVAGGESLLVNILIPLIPWLLIFGFIWFFVFRSLRRQSANPVQQALPVYIVQPPVPPEQR